MSLFKNKNQNEPARDVNSKLPNISNLTCPNCQEEQAIELDAWEAMRFDKEEISCPNSYHQWTRQRLGGANLRDD